MLGLGRTASENWRAFCAVNQDPLGIPTGQFLKAPHKLYGGIKSNASENLSQKPPNSITYSHLAQNRNKLLRAKIREIRHMRKKY